MGAGVLGVPTGRGSRWQGGAEAAVTNPLGERRKVRRPPGAGAAIFCHGSPPLPAAEALRLAESCPVPWLHFWKLHTLSLFLLLFVCSALFLALRNKSDDDIC